MALPAGEVYKDAETAGEPLLVQGIIDCLYETADGLYLLDYKTDRIEGNSGTDLKARLRFCKKV